MVEKLTQPPLPTLARIAAALSGAGGDAAAKISAHYEAGGTVRLFARSAWAVQALARAAERRLGRAPVVWLPDYFCDSAAQPLRATGAAIRHYPINIDLAPDWDALRHMAGDAAPDLFLLVHYFGLPADGARAAAFCAENGAALVEDAAHAIETAPGIGEHGDAVFFSPHKLLAIPHGAVLTLRDGAAGFFPGLAERTADTGQATAPVAAWILRRALQSALPGAVLGRLAGRGPESFLDDGVPPPPAPTPGCNPVALRMWAAALADIPGVIARRRANWRRITASAAKVAGWSPLADTPDGWVPYRAVMRSADTATAERIYGRLRAAGCPIESWPDLAREVVADPVRHAAALALRRTLLFLPVHQTLDVEPYCRVLESLGSI
jgi:hypothetical protein